MSNETTNNVRNNSTADFEFTIGEIEFKGITLKNLKMSAHADITDENVKISTDGAIGLLKAIFTFADAKVDKVIEHQMQMDQKRLELRDQEVKASIEENKARTKKYEEESKYWEAKTKNLFKDDPDHKEDDLFGCKEEEKND